MTKTFTGPCYEDLLHDPDPAVQVWHHHLDGTAVEQIRGWVDLSPGRLSAILKVAPPEIIAQDLRYLTGQRAVCIRQTGRDAVMGPDGLPRLLVALLSRQITTSAYRTGIEAIEAELRDGTDGDVHLPHEGIAGGIEMQAALDLIHDHGAPAWEIDEMGGVVRYRRRHAALLRQLARTQDAELKAA